MCFLVDEVKRDFPEVISLVLTGGECTILGKDLHTIINYATTKNLRSRIVSNGHWAVSESRALSYLSRLKDSGLCELNLSTGDEHQKWIPYNRIVYACQAAVKLGMFVAINIESTPHSIFTSKSMITDDLLSKDILAGKIIVKDSLWIEFDGTTYSDERALLNEGPCSNLFNTISVDPYGSLIACCGLTCKNNKYLNLGNIRKHSLRYLYEEQFDDLIKVWIYTHGPKKIHAFVCEKKGIPDESTRYPHICSLCHHVLHERENLQIIRDHINSILPSVILKYEFINSIKNATL
jgi:hypothetical protein